MPPGSKQSPALVHEFTLPVENVRLYTREIGQGQPLVVLHGGPDFNHCYLLPEMDALADSFRLIYYDQRGRGLSAQGVRPEDVSIASEVADLEALREHFKLASFMLLGHSFGGLLALEYATRHPQRVSHLVLMNSAPASHADYMLHRSRRLERASESVEALLALRNTERWQSGDIQADLQYYRIHFSLGLSKPEHVERVVGSLRLNFTPETVRLARRIEDRLLEETWLSEDYDLLPRLRNLDIPSLVLHGDHDLVPVECAEHIAATLPKARFILLQDCGHFAFLGRPKELRQAIGELA